MQNWEVSLIRSWLRFLGNAAFLREQLCLKSARSEIWAAPAQVELHSPFRRHSSIPGLKVLTPTCPLPTVAFLDLILWTAGRTEQSHGSRSCYLRPGSQFGCSTFVPLEGPFPGISFAIPIPLHERSRKWMGQRDVQACKYLASHSLLHCRFCSVGTAVNISETLAPKSARHTVNTESAPSKRLAMNYEARACFISPEFVQQKHQAQTHGGRRRALAANWKSFTCRSANALPGAGATPVLHGGGFCLIVGAVDFCCWGASRPPAPSAADAPLRVGLRVTIWLRFRFICTKTHWRPGLMNINILNDREKICFMGLQTGSVSVLLLQNHRKIAPISRTFGLPPSQSSNSQPQRMLFR